MGGEDLRVLDRTMDKRKGLMRVVGGAAEVGLGVLRSFGRYGGKVWGVEERLGRAIGEGDGTWAEV